MKHLAIVTAVLSSLLVFTGCKKDEDVKTNCTITLPEPKEQEIKAIENYLQVNNISNAIKSESGFYYIIEEPGTGAKPQDGCTTVLVNYKGALVNGAVFEESTNQTFELGSVIKGWQAGLLLIAGGGKIKLFIPPSLAYGVNGTSSIPGNAMLIFDIDLVKVD